MVSTCKKLGECCQDCEIDVLRLGDLEGLVDRRDAIRTAVSIRDATASNNLSRGGTGACAGCRRLVKIVKIAKPTVEISRRLRCPY